MTIGNQYMKDLVNLVAENLALKKENELLKNGKLAWSSPFNKTMEYVDVIAQMQRASHIMGEVNKAVVPFVHFITCFDSKPLTGYADHFYSIHMGTEFEATLRLSDFRKLKELKENGISI